MTPFSKIFRLKSVFMTIASMLFFTALITLACSDQNEPQTTGTDITAEDVKEKAEEAIETAGAYTQQQKNAYMQDIRARINDLDKRIDQLQAKADSEASALEQNARATLNQNLEELRQLKQETEVKYEELKSSSDQAWSDVKSGLDAAVGKLSQALDQAASRFE